eukprot:TRINITY_DN2897_c0_g1_i2.p1 TRINITY_DN2897_c0_g1~~TRINITY_DN2897_c0_g1_i2.p1  ORF type:complete len:159 (-),score=33.15 TRINITY_DN2897_c0_g1_i2:117-572(-)
METLQIANVPHYSVGGSLHLVVNNQVGFTTPGERARSSRHCTDLAKQIGAPVIHVNGDHPEDLVRATRLAIEYRQKFRKDIFVNLVCFRRWGHNELDDPTFTNPALYPSFMQEEVFQTIILINSLRMEYSPPRRGLLLSLNTRNYSMRISG